MALKLITAPNAEPLSLNEAKLHLRVDGSDEDAVIELWIKAARQVAEAHMGRHLITQTWDWTLDAFPSDMLRPPVGPVQSVTIVKYIEASAGVLTTLDAANYVTDLAGEPARIAPAYGLTWPSTRNQIAAVTVRLVTGYGDAGDTVPEDIRSAIKLIVGHLYQNREDVAVAMGTLYAIEIPKGSEWLMAPYRSITL